MFQIAAHEEIVPLQELYRACEIAYELVGEGLGVGRVIARPFVGQPGQFTRTANRRDYALPPSGETLLDRVKAAALPVVAIGKIEDLFAGRGITRAIHTASDDEGMDQVDRADGRRDARGLIFVEPRRLRHAVRPRNDVAGYAANLERFDRPAAAAAAAAARRPTCSSSPPITATIRRRRAPITRASTCRCSSTGAARPRRRRPRARAGRSPISARRWPSSSASAPLAARHELSRSGEIVGVSDRSRDSSKRASARCSRRRRPRAPTRAAACGPSRRRRPAGVSARSRSHHPLQGVPAAEAQDAGLLRADRRPLPHAADAHARGVADRADDRQGPAAARGADRSDRARPRSRPHAVRPRRRARSSTS